MSHLTLLSWNVRYFGHPSGGVRATDASMRRLAEAIATVDPLPDLIALQEVETTSLRGGLGGMPQIERFRDHLVGLLDRRGTPCPWECLYFPAHRYEIRGLPPLYTTGLAVLVRPTVEVLADNADTPHDVTCFRLPTFRAFKQRRICAHVRIRERATGRELDLFNTHLSLPAFLEAAPHTVPGRMGHGTNQLQEIAGVLDFVASQRRDGPTILVGDFNALPGSPVYRAVTSSLLQDAFAGHHGHGVDDLHAYPTASFMHLRMRLDHVFATPEVHWEAFPHAPRIDQPGPFLGLSDHAPIVGRFRLR